MSNNELTREDKIGQEIHVGSIVVAPNGYSSLKICRVINITPKQLKCSDVNNTSKYANISYKYPNEVVCLDDLDATMVYLLMRKL